MLDLSLLFHSYLYFCSYFFLSASTSFITTSYCLLQILALISFAEFIQFVSFPDVILYSFRSLLAAPTFFAWCEQLTPTVVSMVVTARSNHLQISSTFYIKHPVSLC